MIALALSLVMLFAFQAVFKPAASKRAAKSEQVNNQTQTIQTKQVTQEEAALTRLAAQEPTAEAEREEVIRTDKFTLVFSNVGGTLKGISLQEFKEKDKGEILYLQEEPSERLSAINSKGLKLDTRTYQVSKGQDYIEYKLTIPGQVEITKRYEILKSNDYIDLTIKTKNLSTSGEDFFYTIIGASSIQGTKTTGQHVEMADVMLDGKVWREKAVKGSKAKTGIVSWLGVKNQYFTTIFKPENPLTSTNVSIYGGKYLVIAMDSPMHKIAPGETVVDKYKIYAGPLDEKRISVLGGDATSMIDYGFFGGVSKLLLSALRLFHGWTNSWGIAIVLLTVAINILLFPLTLKSFVSMQQMKKVQPHVEKLKELHKDNPQKMNKEIMELYRKYNVNPLGGCLPLLLQMPIFIALYQALMNTIDLKGGKFLWIKDLSRPDAVPIPATLPFIGNSINILPLLMVVGMFLQQKISQGTSAAMTEEQAKQQKIMMFLFPVLFGFMFYNMPAGLVLYWLTNTVLMTAEQGLISRRMS